MKQFWRKFPLKGFEPFKGATGRDENLKAPSYSSKYAFIGLSKTTPISALILLSILIFGKRNDYVLKCVTSLIIAPHKLISGFIVGHLHIFTIPSQLLPSPSIGH